ncbi:MAG: 5'-methylthioadenosine/adenosylhomocysteine nucleosidase [Bacteroidales bacterium]|nr:5'-methylthioadenosine/adenosylhomocysteine nucleosidase [Bacteroidales bacterium]
MKIGILVAMEKELRAVRAAFGEFSERIHACQSGFGKVNAAVTASSMIKEAKVDCIINSGCAGGLSPDVNVLDIVIGAEVSYHDVWCGPPYEIGQMQGLPARFAADPSLLEAAKASAAGAIDTTSKVHSGLIVSGDRFCSGKDETDAILANFPDALAVDMESAAIAQVCHLMGVPFLSFRVVSDSAYAGDSRLDAYYDFWDAVTGTSFNFLKHFIDSI